MTRLSRAVALTAVTLALPLGAMACNKEEKTAEAPGGEAGRFDRRPSRRSPARETPVQRLPSPRLRRPARPRQPGQHPGMPATAGRRRCKKPDSVKDKHVEVADKIVDTANKFGDDLQGDQGRLQEGDRRPQDRRRPAPRVSWARPTSCRQDLKGDQAAMTWFQQTYGPKMMTALQKVGAVLQQCSTDKEFAAAFESLGLGRPRQPPPRRARPNASPRRAADGQHDRAARQGRRRTQMKK